MNNFDGPLKQRLHILFEKGTKQTLVFNEHLMLQVFWKAFIKDTQKDSECAATKTTQK